MSYVQLIRRGDRSSEVADLQTRLERLGFEISPAERGGFFGESTERAVREFQQQRGADVDGIVGPETWRELSESSWRLGDRVLAVGDPPVSGDDVRDLQVRLNALGLSVGKEDGIFGFDTARGLREFQRNLAISEDGIAGKETVAALNRLSLVTRRGLGARIRERETRRAVPRGLAGKKIAIDPGHGGDDLGARGPSGEVEAGLVFHLAALVAKLLEEKGAVTILTRGPHGGSSEAERAALANTFAADLFVSIHLNSHTSEEAEGAATYFFAHSGVASEPGEHLAELVRSALVAAGRIDCRAHGKGYPILRDTAMTAVVVEPCFVTSPEEAKLCADPSGSQLLATAIASALERYFAEEPA